MTGPDPQALDAADGHRYELVRGHIIRDGVDIGVATPSEEALWAALPADQRPAPGLVEAAREAERLRDALRARDDTLAMVLGLPDFQRRHPQFADGIRRMLDAALPPKETP